MRIEYIRDGLIEEFHEGIFCDFAEGKSQNIYPYYLRSCAKPLQAALLEDFGADLTEKELALCCGSHAGEDCHIETARGIMKKYCITEDMLKCGVHAPLSRTMQDKMLLRGETPTQIHNNCSGKHIGFLVLCRINGWDTENYYELEHPLQQAVIKKIYEMCGIVIDTPLCPPDISPARGAKSPALNSLETSDYCVRTSAPPAGEADLRTDDTNVSKVVRIASKANGQELCSESEILRASSKSKTVPEEGRGVKSNHRYYAPYIKKFYEISTPLWCSAQHPSCGDDKNLNHTVTQSLSHYPITTDGCGVPIVSMPLYNMLAGYINLLKYEKIIRAIYNNPYIYGGENRLDTEIIEKTNGLIAKVGAGGLCIVLNTEKQDAFVIKINDCSMDARRFAVLETINRLGWGNIEFDNTIKTIHGKIVGKVIVT